MQQTQAEIVQQSQQNYSITGVVDFLTAPDLMQQAVVFFKTCNKSSKQSIAEKIIIDLSQITDCNSAGLTLMLEMSKQAHNNNLNIQFKNPPETLLTIAKAYGVEDEIRELCQ